MKRRISLSTSIFCVARATERSARCEAARDYGRKKGVEKRRERGREGRTNLRSVRSATTLAAPRGQGRGPSDSPRLSLSAEPRRYACRFFFSRDLRTTRLCLLSGHEEGQFLEPRSVAGSRALEARLERCLIVMGQLLSHVALSGAHPR